MVDSGFTDLSTNVETRELDLSGDVTGVRRSDQERTVPPRQAQQSVVLACGLAGLTEFKEGDVDTVFPERTLDLCLGLRSSIQSAETVRLVYWRSLPLGIRARLCWKNPEWQSTPTPYLLSSWLGCPFPSRTGEGQQFSCRCCVRHGQLEFPRHKTPDSSLNGLRDPPVLCEKSAIPLEPSQTGCVFSTRWSSL